MFLKETEISMSRMGAEIVYLEQMVKQLQEELQKSNAALSALRKTNSSSAEPELPLKEKGNGASHVSTGQG